MELDQLRAFLRQQPREEEPGLSAPEIHRLRAEQSTGLLEGLRANARWELAFNLLVLAVLPAIIYRAPNVPALVVSWCLVPVALVSLYYFYRKLRLLRQLTVVVGGLRERLTQLVAGMRQLIRFYYRFTLALVPVALLVGLLVGLYETENGVRPAFSLAKLALGLAITAVAGSGLFWGTARATRWYLQRLYGQHLDRLERYLLELDETPDAHPDAT
jgi:hypothetical protein